MSWGSWVVAANRRRRSCLQYEQQGPGGLPEKYRFVEVLARGLFLFNAIEFFLA
jgi:hypothetical protein